MWSIGLPLLLAATTAAAALPEAAPGSDAAAILTRVGE